MVDESLQSVMDKDPSTALLRVTYGYISTAIPTLLQ
jgi:hypothetical protein